MECVKMILSDESKHRDVNHKFATLHEKNKNPKFENPFKRDH